MTLPAHDVFVIPPELEGPKSRTSDGSRNTMRWVILRDQLFQSRRARRKSSSAAVIGLDLPTRLIISRWLLRDFYTESPTKCRKIIAFCTFLVVETEGERRRLK